MSARERDVLKVMQRVLDDSRKPVGAGQLINRCPRQVARIRVAIPARGDQAVIHGLRGKPSNAAKGDLKARAPALCRQRLMDFGPPLIGLWLALSHPWRKSARGQPDISIWLRHLRRNSRASMPVFWYTSQFVI